ncbi:hypothetical protein Tco_0888159 [Tanacetum coccineum]
MHIGIIIPAPIVRVSEIPGNPKSINVFSSLTTDVEPHIQEQQPDFQRYSSRTIQEIQNINSNFKSNSNGNICGDVPIEKFKMLGATDFLGDEALRFAKIMQDKKSISKKERDKERMPSKIKKKGKGKTRMNNILHAGDNDLSCSISQEDSEDDESVSMYTLGASLGITLDRKSARSKNDVFSDFLLEVNNNEMPHPPLRASLMALRITFGILLIHGCSSSIFFIIIAYNFMVELFHLGSSTYNNYKVHPCFSIF